MLKQTSNRESGQSMILIALLMSALVGMLGLVFDGGTAYLQRRKMQNASDAGAFAGARTLALATDSSNTTECSILQSIQTYAISNGSLGAVSSCGSTNANIHGYFVDATGAQVGVEMPGNAGVPAAATGVRVKAQTSFNTYFLAVVSQKIGTTAAQATAQRGQLSSLNNLMPMAVMTQTFVYGQNYQLQGDNTGPGGFGWLSFDCASSTGDLVGYLYQTTASGTWSVGQSICSGPGVKSSSQVKSALDAWLAKPEAQRQWTVPVYDTTTGSGSNLKYHIVGFAQFTFSAYNFNSGNKNVSGYFIHWLRIGDITPTAKCNFGLCGTTLSK